MDRFFLEPREVSEVVKRIGTRKAEASVRELFWFGVLAGIYIALGAQTSLTILTAGGSCPSVTRFLAATAFSVGLMLVLIPGAELFTGNILMTVGLFDRKYNLAKMLRNWLVVYLGNFLGSLLLAWMVVKTGLLGSIWTGLTPVGQTAVTVAENKLALGFSQAFFSGVLCNMLVCLAVLMCLASQTVTGKILGILFPIMAFVACGYEHSIANMFFLPLGLLADGRFLSGFLLIWKNLVPVTLGNIIGGVLLIVFHPKTHLKRVPVPERR